MQLQEKVALVTGAASGIGRAAALLLAREGARVALLDLRPEPLEEAAGAIRAEGGEAVTLPADVSRPEQMEKVIREAGERWGRLDIVFANAGINGVWAPLEDLTPEEWDRTLEINLKGTFLTVKYALPYLKQRGGSVIVTSSINGTRVFSNTGATAYSCSKGAQVIFVKMVALELAAHRVRVNAICPGGVHTNIRERTETRNLDRVRFPVEFPRGAQPLKGESAAPEEIARLVLFLASDASSHITGTELWIDGAESLVRA